jgi:anti-anti-sigma factor
MDAKVNQVDGVYVVSLSGQMDFESADALRAKCRQHFFQQKVVFDLGQLSFVGSSGITPFLELLKDLLSANGNKLKVCAVSTEFIRLFEAGRLVGLEVYENSQQARMAFQFPPFIPEIPAALFDKS